MILDCHTKLVRKFPKVAWALEAGREGAGPEELQGGDEGVLSLGPGGLRTGAPGSEEQLLGERGHRLMGGASSSDAGAQLVSAERS